jgi:hypothetical protein
MKPAIVFAAAFLVSTGASAGAKYAMTPPPLPPKPAADSLKAANDSTHKDTTEAGGGQPPGGETPSELPRIAAPRTDSAKPAAATTAGAVTPPAVPMPVPNLNGKITAKPIELEQAVARAMTAATAPKDTATEGAERRVSKIFTSMDAKQAAKVLEHMTDGDIHVILGYVGPRQAAAILTELKPERVAALSKLAMKPASKQ